jgi:hypothetical protein
MQQCPLMVSHGWTVDGVNCILVPSLTRHISHQPQPTINSGRLDCKGTEPYQKSTRKHNNSNALAALISAPMSQSRIHCSSRLFRG